MIAESEAGAEPTTKQHVVASASVLLVRHILMVILKLVGVFTITRLLGPEHYGLYVSATAIYQFSLLLFEGGIWIYLIRSEKDVSENDFKAAYSVLLAIGVVITCAMLLVSEADAARFSLQGAVPVLHIVAAGFIFQLLTIPPKVRLEREFRYVPVAILELAGQVALYVIAVPMALAGFGALAMATGFVFQQVLSCLLAHYYSRTIPAFALSRKVIVSMLRYAAAYSLMNMIWNSRTLVNPLVVAPILGPHAVGVIGMANAILDVLAVVRNMAWRLGLVALSTIQSDAARLRTAMTEGMELQMLALGGILLGFDWLGRIVLFNLFGEQWLPVMDVYPFIAIGVFTNATFGMQSSVLSLLNRNSAVAIFSAVHVVLFALGAYFAVPHFGIIGYGLGEIIALPSYFVLHFFANRAVGSPDYSRAWMWYIAVVIGLMWETIGAWAIAAPFLVLLLPNSRSRLDLYWNMVRAHRSSRVQRI